VLAALEQLSADLKERLRSAAVSSAEHVSAQIDTLKSLTGIGHAEIRINSLIDAAHFFYVLGQQFQALDPAAAAVALARQASNDVLLRKALTVEGVMYADSGNISVAVEKYAEALQLVEKLGDREAECIVWVNLGVALMYGAQYSDAIACFEHVIAVAQADSRLAHALANAHTNIALCALHLEDYGRGLKAAQAAIDESSDPRSAPELISRVIRESNYARLLIEVGSLDRARERCKAARHYATLSKSARAETITSAVEGLLEVYSGNTDVGISRLTSALERARLLRSHRHEVLAALVKAYEYIGQPERALVYLREMIEDGRQRQQDNALNHVRLHLKGAAVTVEGGALSASRLKRQEEALEGKVAQRELFVSRIEMLERLAVTAELRDDSTGEHSYRVGRLAACLAAEFGCDDNTCFMIDLAARLHDIGKIGVPDAILLKPDKLNDAERQIMRTHATVGAELLSKSNIPHMQMAEEIARSHHEWWDGSGYPANLSGSAIPLAARITALADVFDALTHKRPYKEAWRADSALDEIAKLKGRQFDPQLTDLFLVLVVKLRREKGDLDDYLGQAAHASPFLQARSKIWETLRKSKQSDDTGSGSRLDLQR
jgi:putative two-component system response regulator